MSLCVTGVHLAVLVFVAVLCSFVLDALKPWHCSEEGWTWLIFYFPMILFNNVLVLGLMLWRCGSDADEEAKAQTRGLLSRSRSINPPPALQASLTAGAKAVHFNTSKAVNLSMYDNVPLWEYREFTNNEQ